MTYDPKNLETLYGKVAALGTFDAGGPRLATLSLKTSGDLVTVVLGPTRDGGHSGGPPGPADDGAVPPPPAGVLPGESPVATVGDAVAVKGARSQYRGEPVILAAEVTVSGRTRRLRDPATGELLGGGPGQPPQDGPSGRASGGPDGSDRLYMRVRGVWRVPEEEAVALLRESSPRPPLEEFAVLAMVRRYSGLPLQEVRALRARQKSWTEVAQKVGGGLADLVFRGDARHPLSWADGEPGQSPPPPSDDRVFDLARVMTLERLTGLNPASIRRDLEAGESFESLIESTARQSAPGRSQDRSAGPSGPPPGGQGGSGGPPR